MAACSFTEMSQVKSDCQRVLEKKKKGDDRSTDDAVRLQCNRTIAIVN
jgi:hypothetical protein